MLYSFILNIVNFSTSAAADEDEFPLVPVVAGVAALVLLIVLIVVVVLWLVHYTMVYWLLLSWFTSVLFFLLEIKIHRMSIIV